MVTLTELKTFLGITTSDEDARLQQILDGVENAVKRYCGREFAQASYTERVYFYSGVGTVRETPVSAVSSIVTIEGTTLTLYTFSESGIVEIQEYYDGRATVTYTGGYSAIPDDLKLAILRWCEYLYTKPEALEGQNFEGISVSYTEAPAFVLDVLNGYKVMEI